MPNTTNYSFPTPADTDLVKNGADAIRDLGDAVDTAMNTALGTKKAGMVLLNTTSFSGVASQSVSDVFSSTYDNYRILINATSFTGTLTMRFRVSGADNSTSNYKMNTYGTGLWTTSVYSGYQESGSTLFNILGEASPTSLSLDILNPFATQKTFLHGHTSQNDRGRAYQGLFDATTSFTGFTLLATSVTGNVSVYGYNK